MKNLKLTVFALSGIAIILLCSFYFLNKNKKIPNNGEITYKVITKKEGVINKKNSYYYYNNQQQKGCTKIVGEDQVIKIINNFQDSTINFIINGNNKSESIAVKGKWFHDVTIDLINEEKKINGYNCKKGIANLNQDFLSQITFWYVPTSNFRGGILGGIPNFNHLILETNMQVDSSEIAITLVDIKPNKDESVFKNSDNATISIDLSQLKDFISALETEKK